MNNYPGENHPNMSSAAVFKIKPILFNFGYFDRENDFLDNENK